jgi:hypothetical protein
VLRACCFLFGGVGSLSPEPVRLLYALAKRKLIVVSSPLLRQCNIEI